MKFHVLDSGGNAKFGGAVGVDLFLEEKAVLDHSFLDLTLVANFSFWITDESSCGFIDISCTYKSLFSSGFIAISSAYESLSFLLLRLLYNSEIIFRQGTWSFWIIIYFFIQNSIISFV